jgi:hypothetical protein
MEDLLGSNNASPPSRQPNIHQGIYERMGEQRGKSAALAEDDYASGGAREQIWAVAGDGADVSGREEEVRVRYVDARSVQKSRMVSLRSW